MFVFMPFVLCDVRVYCDLHVGSISSTLSVCSAVCIACGDGEGVDGGAQMLDDDV